MGLGSLFFKQEDPKPAAVEAPEQESAAPAVAPRSSRAGAASKNRGAVATADDEQEDTSADGGVDKDMLANLEKALDDNKGKSFGYLQFRESLGKMEKKIPNEGQRFAAALAASEGMGCDANSITSTAQAALAVLSGEQKQFNAEITELQKADAAKQAKVTDIESQIHALQQQQTKLNKELATSAASLQTKQNNFAVTYKSLVAEIKSDIEKVTEYSSK